MRAASIRNACVVGLALAASPALADDRDECLAASSSAQDLRHDNKLLEARAQLLVCAREVCPAVVRRDCATWLTEVETSMPTFVITVRDDRGMDVIVAHVQLDGAPYLERLEGAALPINPGVHKIRVDAERARPLEQEVVIREGEKNRSVVLTLAHQEPRPVVEVPRVQTAKPELRPAASTDDDRRTHGDLFTLTTKRKIALGLGGVGAVGVIAGIFLGASAQSKHDSAHALCADPQVPCADAASATALSTSAHGLAIDADLALGIGAAALIGGGVLWLVGGPEHQGLAIVPSPRGASLVGRF